MFNILSYCDINWLCVALSWLLPFLLGLLLGWALWAKFKKWWEDLKSENDSLKLKISNLEEELKKCGSLKNSYVSEIALLNGRIKEMEAEKKEWEVSKKETAKAFIAEPVLAAVPKSDKYAALKEDNLQVVEGIGPKMNELLNTNGVHTWTHLAAKSSADLREMLDAQGNKYSMIDPATWPDQAALARDGKWNDLIEMQKKLDTGRTNQTTEETDSKVESVMIKLGILKRYTQDDLKAIEGIGPKIETLLHDAGIRTWKELAQTGVDKIQGILDSAGSKFALADPATWPKQAELAADGKWEEFEAYLAHLNKGKE